MDVEGMREIECTRWFIGRCVVFGVQVVVLWWLVQVRVRWDTEGFVWKLSASCVTSMHAIQSIRLFDDDVT